MQHIVEQWTLGASRICNDYKSLKNFVLVTNLGLFRWAKDSTHPLYVDLIWLSKLELDLISWAHIDPEAEIVPGFKQIAALITQR